MRARVEERADWTQDDLPVAAPGEGARPGRRSRDTTEPCVAQWRWQRTDMHESRAAERESQVPCLATTE